MLLLGCTDSSSSFHRRGRYVKFERRLRNFKNHASILAPAHMTVTGVKLTVLHEIMTLVAVIAAVLELALVNLT